MEYFVEQVIRAAPADVAKIMFDPDCEDQWCGNLVKAEKLTEGPIGVGTRVRHGAEILGLTVPFVTEVTAFEPDRRMDMKFVEGPVSGELVYQVALTAGGTVAMVHVRDHAPVPVPRSTWVRERRVRDDLVRLAGLVLHPKDK